MALVQSFGIALFLEAQNSSGLGAIVPTPGFGFRIMTMITLTTGTAFIMWLGEQISERGIGNGISLIIYAGIVVGFPNAVASTVQDIRTGNLGFLSLVLLGVIMVAVVAAIVFVERAKRRIPIQYARRVVGRRVYGGASTYLPMRVNTGGVIPVIFASSMLAIPQTIGQVRWFQDAGWIQELGEGDGQKFFFQKQRDEGREQRGNNAHDEDNPAGCAVVTQHNPVQVGKQQINNRPLHVISGKTIHSRGRNPAGYEPVAY